MSVIETRTFRLRTGVDERAFLDADYRVQTEFIPNHHGLLRRTTARADDGGWVVVTLWATPSDADASAAQVEGDPVMAAFTAAVDPASVVTRRYATLD